MKRKMKAMIGVCGDNCSYCHRYIATQDGSHGALEKVKSVWVRLGLRDADFPAHELKCRGCRPENKCAYPKVRACAAGKGIGTCGQCPAYPCELINAIFAASRKLQSCARRVCSPEEMDALTGAFFSKRENLDRIHSGK